MSARLLLDDLDAEPKPTVARLEEVYARHRSERRFVERIAEAVGSGDAGLERSGAWLLRRHAKSGEDLPAAVWTEIVEGLAGLKTWEARLLLCQLLSDRPELADANPARVADFLCGATEDKNPLIRAWGISSLVALGQRHKAFSGEARRRLAKARRDAAASVRARLRHLPPR
jgi:hypothetical protein